MTKKLSKKNIICLICVTLALLILIGAVVGGAVMFRDKIYLLMPTSYICKQIEKEIPIGSDAETVIEYLESKHMWSSNYDDDFIEKDYKITQGSPGKYLVNFAAFHSFNNINYKNENLGCYFTSACLGYIPFRGTSIPIGSWCQVVFIFDSNLKIIDIIVYRHFIGF